MWWRMWNDGTIYTKMPSGIMRTSSERFLSIRLCCFKSEKYKIISSTQSESDIQTQYNSKLSFPAAQQQHIIQIQYFTMMKKDVILSEIKNYTRKLNQWPSDKNKNLNLILTALEWKFTVKVYMFSSKVLYMQ